MQQRDLAEAVAYTQPPDFALVFGDENRAVRDRVVAVTGLAFTDDRGAGGEARVARLARERLERGGRQRAEDAESAQDADLDNRDRRFGVDPANAPFL